MVKVNGNVEDVGGMTLDAYLAATDYDISRIAVEKNGNIVPKSEYGNTILCDGDVIEVVSFVGGG